MTVKTTIDYQRLFAAHRDCCRRLLELSSSQDELINADDYEQLIAVLGKKQQVLLQLEEFSKHRPRIAASWQTERDGLDPQTRENCDQLLGETESILEELVQREERSSQLLQNRRLDTQKAICDIDQGGKVSEAYRDSLAPATHRRLDVGQ